MKRFRRPHVRWWIWRYLRFAGSTTSFAEAREHIGPRRGKEGVLTEAATKLGLCQVRSETDRPCPHPAVVEIWGIPFCERCAREQAAYFAIGEITQELTVDRAKLSKLLIELKGSIPAKRGIRSGQLGGRNSDASHHRTTACRDALERYGAADEDASQNIRALVMGLQLRREVRGQAGAREVLRSLRTGYPARGSLTPDMFRGGSRAEPEIPPITHYSREGQGATRDRDSVVVQVQLTYIHKGRARQGVL